MFSAAKLDSEKQWSLVLSSTSHQLVEDVANDHLGGPVAAGGRIQGDDRGSGHAHDQPPPRRQANAGWLCPPGGRLLRRDGRRLGSGGHALSATAQDGSHTSHRREAKKRTSRQATCSRGPRFPAVPGATRGLFHQAFSLCGGEVVLFLSPQWMQSHGNRVRPRPKGAVMKSNEHMWQSYHGLPSLATPPCLDHLDIGELFAVPGCSGHAPLTRESSRPRHPLGAPYIGCGTYEHHHLKIQGARAVQFTATYGSNAYLMSSRA